MIGAIFGVFGVAFCAFATPRAMETQAPRQRPAEPHAFIASVHPRPRWRDRRIGVEGWAAVGVCVVVIAVLLLTGATAHG